MNRRHVLLGAGAFAVKAPGYDVREYGAAPDGRRPSTKPIQDAIDACHRGGGGTVFLPAGKYVSGTLTLRDHVTLHLEAGATLQGSTALVDYPSRPAQRRSYTDNYTERSLIFVEKAQNVAIEGQGEIDGQGASFSGEYKSRPYLMRFIDCRDVRVAGVTLSNAAMWVQHYLACDEVAIHGVRVHSRVNQNNDGIDMDSCQRVTISDCEVTSGDDAIVLKSTTERITRDVTVSNCVLSSACNALKLGTESNGGFDNILLSNCTIYETRLAGLALEMVDGGVMERITVSNLTMRNVGTPIFLRLGNRARPFQEGRKPGMGRMRGIQISGIQATEAGRTGCAISGIPGYAIEDVTLENIRLRFTGNATRREAERPIPENEDKYPEHNMFGTLPAYGFYCRHVRNLRMRGLETGFGQADERPAVYCEDVDDFDLDGGRMAAYNSPAVRLRNVRNASLKGCRTINDLEAYVEVSGRETSNINLFANDFRRAGAAFRTLPDAPPDQVLLAGNRPARNEIDTGRASGRE